MDMAGLLPRYINIRRGAYIGLIVSMALCPWQLLASASTFTAVLNGFAVFFAPICGIQICDYFVIRTRRIKLTDLYHSQSHGIYYFWHGVNVRTVVAWLCGWIPLVPGLAKTANPAHAAQATLSVEHIDRFYDLNVFYGFFVAFLVYYLACKIWTPPALGETDTEDVFGTFTPEDIGTVQVITSVDSPNDQSVADLDEKPSSLTLAPKV